MIGIFEQIWRETLARLSRIVTNHLPGVLAALVILLVAWVVAVAARAVLLRIFKGVGVDRFLRRSGLDSLVPGAATVRMSVVVPRLAYWAVMVGGSLLALSAFDTQLTARIIDSVLLLLPKLVAGTAILLAGVWISRYLGRSALVWAFNEGFPSARRISHAVRVVVMFVSVVVAADYLDFARNVFLAAFVLLVGGAMVAAGVALGLGGRRSVERFLEEKDPEVAEPREERTWEHI
jgi:Mechanosensitive ion channel, conserved TM helix